MEDYFLKINKQYFTLCKIKHLKLDIIDVAIMAQIEELHRNNRECFFSNETLAENFGVSDSTIKRRLTHLCDLGFVFRKTNFVSDRGQASKQRFLYVNEATIQATIKESEKCPKNRTKQGSNLIEAKVKKDESKGQNDPIKEKKKIIKEDNIYNNNIDFDLYRQNDISSEYVMGDSFIEDINRENNMFDNDFIYKIQDMPTLLDDYGIGVYGEDPADVYDYFVDNIMINYDEGFSADEIAVDFEWPVGFVQAVVDYYGL